MELTILTNWIPEFRKLLYLPYEGGQRTGKICLFNWCFLRKEKNYITKCKMWSFAGRKEATNQICLHSKKAVIGDNSCALGSLVALLAIKATHSRHVTVMSSSYRCSSPACNLQLANANACSCGDFSAPAASPLTPPLPPTPPRFFTFFLSKRCPSVCLRSGVYDLVQAKACSRSGFITLKFRSCFI